MIHVLKGHKIAASSTAGNQADQAPQKLSTIQVCSFLVHQIQTRFVVFSSSCVQSVEADDDDDDDDPFPDEQQFSEDVFFPHSLYYCTRGARDPEILMNSLQLPVAASLSIRTAAGLFSDPVPKY
jgi:hypothetical protein